MKHSPSQIKADLKKVYEEISQKFSDTRSQAWPEFELVSNSISSGDKILDLGCGNGRLYQYLVTDLGMKIDYTGLDFCESFLEIAKKRYPEADFIEGDISSFEIDKRFDSIVSIAAFHHLPSRSMRKKCLKRIFEQLEDDGTLIVSVWNLWQRKYMKQHVNAFFSWLLGGFRGDRRGLMIPFGKEKIERYYHAFTVTEMRRLLHKQGFQIQLFELSRHNYFFICKKKMTKAQSHPIKTLAAERRHTMNPSHAATCK